MTDILATIIPPVITAAIAAAVGSSVFYLFSRRQRRIDRTPVLLFDFADLAEHENLGAVGFRNIESKLELLISGTLRKVGLVLARDIRLDIYHFQSSRPQPTHEIANIHIADALEPGASLSWSKSVRLADLTVDGPYYKSGSTGVFRDDGNFRYYHYHVVFSCKNVQGEISSSIYGTEKIIENDTFEGNKMLVVRQVGGYKPEAEFPAEWRSEIDAKELSVKHLTRRHPHHDL
ncbi:hypothetical protein [Limobrevibacterium gyesilva]|uniref:Uncharacterized protein n=1 Tax=Limobrevibacterium gyesilva TaxID=2991712 RepID=A0AA41YKZ9_9PROT|nr:hypothetical protein [Limobrevibacterium gyesilva]MCW3475716.1 hypothetical protein [Limobrevibacterium gyesilva]